MAQFKLTYFDMKGRGEIIRLALVVAGYKFEDVRHQLEEWPAVKAKTPYGTLPMLENISTGLVMTESLAITRYLAREGGIAGSTNLETFFVDEYVDMIIEMREKAYDNHFYATPETKEEKKKKIFNETIPTKLKALEAKLKDSKGFFVGNKVTLADIVLFSTWENLMLDTIKVDILKDFPKLMAIVNNVKKDPKIAAYLVTRNKTDY